MTTPDAYTSPDNLYDLALWYEQEALKQERWLWLPWRQPRRIREIIHCRYVARTLREIAARREGSKEVRP
jgi:hypothetical protein